MNPLILIFISINVFILRIAGDDDLFAQPVAHAQKPGDHTQRRGDKSDGHIIQQEERRSNDQAKARNDGPGSLQDYLT